MLISCSVVFFAVFFTSNSVFSKPIKSEASLFRFANIYGDHMVLQQAPFRANVWGYGEAGQAVVVNIANIAYQAQAAKGENIFCCGSIFIYKKKFQ